MDYPPIRGEYFPDYARYVTWNFLHANIDAQNQIIFDEYTGDGAQAI